MSDQDAPIIRAALQSAKDDLLEGRVPGPLTSVRLVEVAGVKPTVLPTTTETSTTNFSKERAN